MPENIYFHMFLLFYMTHVSLFAWTFNGLLSRPDKVFSLSFLLTSCKSLKCTTKHHTCFCCYSNLQLALFTTFFIPDCSLKSIPTFVFLWFQIAICQILCVWEATSHVFCSQHQAVVLHFFTFDVYRYSKPSLSCANLLYIQFTSVSSGVREYNWFTYIFFYTNTAFVSDLYFL